MYIYSLSSKVFSVVFYESRWPNEINQRVENIVYLKLTTSMIFILFYQFPYSTTKKSIASVLHNHYLSNCKCNFIEKFLQHKKSYKCRERMSIIIQKHNPIRQQFMSFALKGMSTFSHNIRVYIALIVFPQLRNSFYVTKNTGQDFLVKGAWKFFAFQGWYELPMF